MNTLKKAEEKVEQMETQLEEANEVAVSSNQKYEDANRKLKVIENDLERIVERAEGTVEILHFP